MDARHVSRRGFLTVTAASLGTALARPVPGRAQAPELVIVGWGGAHEESLKKAVYDPFTAATGRPRLSSVIAGWVRQYASSGSMKTGAEHENPQPSPTAAA